MFFNQSRVILSTIAFLFLGSVSWGASVSPATCDTLFKRTAENQGRSAAESIFQRLNQPDYSVGPKRRFRESALFSDLNNGLSGRFGYRPFPIDEVRDMAWKLFTHPRPRYSLRNEKTQHEVWTSYFRRISRAEPEELSRGSVDLGDWLRLMRSIDLNRQISHQKSPKTFIHNFETELTDAIQNSLAAGTRFSQLEISDLIKMLRSNFEIRKTYVEQTENQTHTAQTYMTKDRVADGYPHLITLDILRGNTEFTALVGDIVSYLKTDTKQGSPSPQRAQALEQLFANP